MSARRLLVSAVLLVTAAAGGGFAASASASTSTAAGVCTNPGPLCAPYDTAKSETAAVLAEVAFACTSTTDVPCATVDGDLQTVYSYVFFPYKVCYDAYPVTSGGCIGPIE